VEKEQETAGLKAAKERRIIHVTTHEDSALAVMSANTTKVIPVPSRSSTTPNSTVGSVLQGLGARLRRTFTSDATTTDSLSEAEPISQSDLNNVLFIAAGAVRRAHAATDYRHSAGSIRAELIASQKQLERAIESFEVQPSRDSSAARERSIALRTVALISVDLGDYDEAEDINYNLCLPMLPSGIQNGILGTHAGPDLEKYQIEVLVHFLMLLANIERSLSFAERLGEWLLTGSCGTQLAQLEKVDVLLALMKVHNLRSEHTRALAHLEWTQQLVEGAKNKIAAGVLGTISLRAAVTFAGLGKEVASAQEFVKSLVINAVGYGMWHRSTLTSLYEYGLALKRWGKNDAAASVLLEAWLGRNHRFGNLHPATQAARHAMDSCSTSTAHSKMLLRHRSAAISDELRLSLAYEHIFLNSVIELLVVADETLLGTQNVLQSMLEENPPMRIETAEHRAMIILRVHRALARCKLEQGDIYAAIDSIKNIGNSIKRSVEGEFQSQLDLLTCYARENSFETEAIDLSRKLFFDVSIKLNRDQAKAFQRRLSQLGFTHFPQETIANDPLPLDVKNHIGTGAYAVVESVEINGQLYARKSMALPRYNQNRIRQTIQNEVLIIQSLAHPHIVRVFFTYEERVRFGIVIEPLAEFDLEAFLDQQMDPITPQAEHYTWMWKWFCCLANTLDFIHDSGIRHKDIKTRNILVKGSDVVFADFGSSHAFLDEETSMTEGPSYGHTLMYCAPEVISWEKRSRSADIFSLGCVYTEMLTTLDNRRISKYYEFRSKASESSATGNTHAYHATLDLVNLWFNEASAENKSFYTDIIKLMLDEDPKKRPAASRISDEFNAVFKRLGKEPMTLCPKCGPFVCQTGNTATISDPHDKAV
jgi:serine/threonine protein kinase